MSASTLINKSKESGETSQKDYLMGVKNRVMGSMSKIISGEKGVGAKEKIVASATSSPIPSQVAERTNSPDPTLTGLQCFQKLGCRAYVNC